MSVSPSSILPEDILACTPSPLNPILHPSLFLSLLFINSRKKKSPRQSLFCGLPWWLRTRQATQGLRVRSHCSKPACHNYCTRAAQLESAHRTKYPGRCNDGPMCLNQDPTQPSKSIFFKKVLFWDFPSVPVAKNLHSNAVNMSLIPSWGTKIPRAEGQLNLERHNERESHGPQLRSNAVKNK